MNLMDYTIEGGFLPRLECGTVAAAVDRMVATLAKGGEVSSASELAVEVMRREAEGSTAIGGGLVIPHARLDGVRRVLVAVATLAEPLDIPSEDGRPVDIVILLVGPEGDPRQMLRVLARLARLVRHDAFLHGLRQATTGDQLRLSFAKVSDSQS